MKMIYVFVFSNIKYNLYAVTIIYYILLPLLLLITCHSLYTSKSINHSPTRGVMAEVNTELLWTTNVTPAPTSMAMYPDSHPNGYGRSVVKEQSTQMTT